MQRTSMGGHKASSETSLDGSCAQYIPLGIEHRLYDFEPHFRFFHRPYRKLVSAALLLSLALGVVAMTESFALKSIADNLLTGQRDLSVFGLRVALGAMLFPFFLLVVAVRVAGNYALDILQARLMIEVRDNVEILVVKNLILHSNEKLREVSIGDLIGRLSTDLPRAMIYREQVVIIANAGVAIVAYSAFVAFYSLPLAVTIVGLATTGALANHALSQSAAAIDKDFRAGSDLARVHIDEFLRGSKEIRTNGLVEAMLVRFAGHLEVRRQPFMRLSYYLARLKASNTAWPALAICATILTLGSMSSDKGAAALDAALLPPLFFIVFAIFKDVTEIVRSMVDLRLVRNSMQRLASYRASDGEITEWSSRNAAPPVEPLQAISLKGATYKYPGDDGGNSGVQEVSITLRRPGWIAISGPSGAGKSTTVDLILREIVPQVGNVHFEPWPDRPNRRDLARHISFLPQLPYLFKGTIWENLSAQLPQESQRSVNIWLTDARLRGLLEASGLGRRLADKANTQQDTLRDDPARTGLELGVGLHGSGWSIGEQKLIGIVRCLASPAEVAILDEPTASLDGGAVQQVIALLRNEAAQRLIITVTHDSAVQKCADRVIELRRGRIVQQMKDATR